MKLEHFADTLNHAELLERLVAGRRIGVLAPTATNASELHRQAANAFSETEAFTEGHGRVTYTNGRWRIDHADSRGRISYACLNGGDSWHTVALDAIYLVGCAPLAPDLLVSLVHLLAASDLGELVHVHR